MLSSAAPTVAALSPVTRAAPVETSQGLSDGHRLDEIFSTETPTDRDV